jgi:hypothetical protein
MKKLLTGISGSTICKKHLPFAPRPVLQAGPDAKIIITGQAPGLKVQQSSKPRDGASGKNSERGWEWMMKYFIIQKRLHRCPWVFVTRVKEVQVMRLYGRMCTAMA